MKKKVVLVILAVLGIWVSYQLMNATTVELGGGIYDEKTGKYYSPEAMKKIKKERESEQEKIQ